MSDWQRLTELIRKPAVHAAFRELESAMINLEAAPSGMNGERLERAVAAAILEELAKES